MLIRSSIYYHVCCFTIHVSLIFDQLELNHRTANKCWFRGPYAKPHQTKYIILYMLILKIFFLKKNNYIIIIIKPSK